ncbi:MAG TPA: sensor histidine kinase [Herpetosiphonaceae bacterium]
MRGRMFTTRLSLAHRFMLTSLLTLAVGMSGIGWWVGQQIEDGVAQRTAATTALYVDSLIAPQLEDLEPNQPLTPDHRANLSRLLQDTPLGQQIVVLKVWDREGRVVYSTDAATIGQVFPIKPWLALALQGTVSAKISDLEDEENIAERQHFARLLEMYTPIRQHTTGQVVAVAEFYQQVDDLQREIDDAQRRSWLVVGVAALVMYLLLSSFVQHASTTIASQQVRLQTQVGQLQSLLSQNQRLHDRVRRAAARTTALNERVLRRISAELHDGPAQDLGLALLRLDHSIVCCTGCTIGADNQAAIENLNIIQSSLRRAMQEIRAISTGLGVPQLTRLTPRDVVERVVRTHERRTGTTVSLTTTELPDDASLAAKITLYRFLQEALTNAYRHAAGLGQVATVAAEADRLRIEVCDQGPGFAGAPIDDCEQHLGLVGMRERVESLGGVFEIASLAGQGTRVSARFPVHAGEGSL